MPNITHGILKVMNWIASGLITALSVFISYFVAFFATLVAVFYRMAINIFNWVCSESFTSLSYTRLDKNPFIEVGWTLTRDLTNIFFILALIVIGLGTALRISGYQMKKALPMLIIAALLINFTPVFCGLIVDASNIVMNFFIQGGFAGSDNLANRVGTQWALLGKSIQPKGDPTTQIGYLAGALAFVFFNLIAGVIYLLFAFLFIIRYVAIWILVILSPFAFVCLIFPATSSVFKQWWSQFLRWSLVGAIAAFFLYLGDHFIQKITDASFFATEVAEVADAEGFAPIVNAILPYFIPIAFLFIGLFASLTFAPQGADGIIKAVQAGGKRGGKAFGKTLGTRTWKGAVKTAKSPLAATRASREAYRIHRGLGRTKRQALGAAMERGWAAMRLQTTGELRPRAMTKSVAKGHWSAIRDSAKAGWGAILKKKKGKKGQQCPQCKQHLPQDVDFCPKCGYRF